MKKSYSFILLFLLPITVFCQVNGNFSGGFESNTQWYLNDKGLKDEFNNPTSHPDEPLRSNNYLFVNYNYKNLLKIKYILKCKYNYNNLKYLLAIQKYNK